MHKCRDCPKLDICKAYSIQEKDTCSKVVGISSNLYFLGHYSFLPYFTQAFNRIKAISNIRDSGLQMTGLPGYLKTVGSFSDVETFYDIMIVFCDVFNEKWQKDIKRLRKKKGKKRR